jgi:hypothetical protein
VPLQQLPLFTITPLSMAHGLPAAKQGTLIPCTLMPG